MLPDPKHPAENLYTKPWLNKKRELLSLATDEACSRVRPEFARWVRGGRK